MQLTRNSHRGTARICALAAGLGALVLVGLWAGAPSSLASRPVSSASRHVSASRHDSASRLVSSSRLDSASRLVSSSRIGPRVASAAPFSSPVWDDSIGRVEFSSPTVAVIDGVTAVVVATETGDVYVINARNGDELPGWPQKIEITPGVASASDSTPVVADLDGPGKPPSIIVGAGSLYASGQPGGLEAFYANGAKRFVFHTGDLHAGEVFGTPAVGDITGNGQEDIVFGSFDHFIYALTPSGSVVPGFPFNNQDTIWSSPALYDSSDTGKDDIFIGADASGNLGCHGGLLWDFRYESGAPRVIWDRCEPQTFWSAPAVGPLVTGGPPAVVIGTSIDAAYLTPTTSDLVYAFYASNGDTVPGWPVHTNGPTFGSPAIGGIQGNGEPAVVSTSCADCATGKADGEVSAWTGAGKLIWKSVMNDQESLASPALVDLTGSDTNDVAVGNPNGLYMFNGRTGAALYGTGTLPLQHKCWLQDAPAATFVPGAGWRLIEVCGGPYQPGRVVAYALPDVPQVPPAWAQWRADSSHDALETDAPAPAPVACRVPASPVGYRFVAGDGGIFDFGEQSYCGSLGATWLAAGVVGMAVTPDGGGYWLATADGAVYAFGDAHLYSGAGGQLPYGSEQGLPLGGPIVGIAATPNGRGYWLVGGDGSVYGFGDATNYGSMGGKVLNDPIVGMAVDPDTGGYWLVASDGGMFAFGDAPFLRLDRQHPPSASRIDSDDHGSHT
jgi:hypothetical protein